MSKTKVAPFYLGHGVQQSHIAGTCVCYCQTETARSRKQRRRSLSRGENQTSLSRAKQVCEASSLPVNTGGPIEPITECSVSTAGIRIYCTAF